MFKTNVLDIAGFRKFVKYKIFATSVSIELGRLLAPIIMPEETSVIFRAFTSSKEMVPSISPNLLITTNDWNH